MGEYWHPVNLTRKEFINPHHVGGCGLKLSEWNYVDSPVIKLIAEAWSKDDDIRAVSDYGGEIHLSDAVDTSIPAPEYDELDDYFQEITGSWDA